MNELESGDEVLRIWREEIPQHCQGLWESFKRRLELCLRDTIKR